MQYRLSCKNPFYQIQFLHPFEYKKRKNVFWILISVTITKSNKREQSETDVTCNDKYLCACEQSVIWDSFFPCQSQMDN